MSMFIKSPCVCYESPRKERGLGSAAVQKRSHEVTRRLAAPKNR